MNSMPRSLASGPPHTCGPRPEAALRRRRANAAAMPARAALRRLSHSAALRDAYPLASDASPSEAGIVAAQDLKICIARYLDRNLANYVPVYGYQFDDRRAPSYFGPVSYAMRAYHTAELQYLFPHFHGGAGTPHPLDAAQQALAQRMVANWTSFAASGTPAAAWPRYSAANDSVERLDTHAPSVTAAYGAGHHCDLWEPVALGAARQASRP